VLPPSLSPGRPHIEMCGPGTTVPSLSIVLPPNLARLHCQIPPDQVKRSVRKPEDDRPARSRNAAGVPLSDVGWVIYPRTVRSVEADGDARPAPAAWLSRGCAVPGRDIRWSAARSPSAMLCRHRLPPRCRTGAPVLGLPARAGQATRDHGAIPGFRPRDIRHRGRSTRRSPGQTVRRRARRVRVHRRAGSAACPACSRAEMPAKHHAVGSRRDLH